MLLNPLCTPLPDCAAGGTPRPNSGKFYTARSREILKHFCALQTTICPKLTLFIYSSFNSDGRFDNHIKVQFFGVEIVCPEVRVCLECLDFLLPTFLTCIRLNTPYTFLEFTFKMPCKYFVDLHYKILHQFS